MEKYGKIWKNQLFFRADMAGLGKYCTGGYGRIGVYRIQNHNYIVVRILLKCNITPSALSQELCLCHHTEVVGSLYR